MKKILTLVIISLFITCYNVDAGNIDLNSDTGLGKAQGDIAKTEYDKLLDSGIEAFYRTNWQKAEQIFGDLKKLDKKDPRAYFLDSLIPFWSYFFAGEQLEDAQKFMKISEQAISLSQVHLHKHPTDTNMVLMLSALYGYRSLVAASENSYSTAVKSGITGFKYTRQILSLNSDDPRALIGKGIFLYMLGSVPPQARWVTNMMGLKGDVEEGLAKLKQASRSDSYVSTDARMILYYLFELEEKHTLALDQISFLANKYPDNVIFKYKLAVCKERLGYTRQAREIYRMVSEINNPHLQELQIKSSKKLKSI